MIWDSAPWKDGLLKDADILQRWAMQSSRPSQQGVIFEKKIFLSAYAMRKLLEARKICTALHRKPIVFSVYERKESFITPLNWDKIEIHYELDFPKQSSRTIWWLFDQIIHSHIFLLDIDNQNYIDGFFISSDKEKEKSLNKIDLTSFLEIMREIGTDYPSNGRHWVDENGKWQQIDTCPKHPFNK
ncbi:hypothetical protein [Thalassobaculum litoreum]|uniref:hypothetical protein n=1 Tax=Thalassobaculum litoreum TaxID=420996 RepID=UPI0011138203|nr:hypothetical protein [Thalassobaculum litoreum]